MALLDWGEWTQITRRIYNDAGLKGYPQAEMKRYWKLAFSPLQALDAAKSRRIRHKDSHDNR